MEGKMIAEWKRREQQSFSGWDFSALEGELFEEQPPWSYIDMARDLIAQATAVLDLGTGGGEKLLGFQDVLPRRTVATEGYPPNVRLAHRRLKPHGIAVVESRDALVQLLPFADGTFDLVIDRHTGFNIAEVERVLKPGGTFLTQQVDGNNLRDLIEAFDSSPQWPYFTLEFALERVRATHLTVEMAQEWTGKTIFKNVGAMVYFLKAIPWLVDGFSVERHLSYLQAQQARLERGEALVFQQKLLVLKARKTGKL
jgi:SAM-dependent methyltransferase